MAYTLNFGKHNGKTLEWLFFNDPGYVSWMIREKAYGKFPNDMKDRFRELVRRARHLKIPGLCTWCKKKPITRMFLTEHPSGGLARVDFDCEDCHPQGGSTSMALKPSFLVSDIYKDYDKLGGEFLIFAIKYAYFKDSGYRMTQKRLEEFFNNPDNFVDF